MIPDLGWVVAAFATGHTASLERAGAVTYTDGIASFGPPTITAIELVPAPPGGRQLDRVSEGDVTRELHTFYVAGPVVIETSRPTGTGAPRPPDVIVWAGVRYIVQTAEAWGPGGYTVVTAAREGA